MADKVEVNEMEARFDSLERHINGILDEDLPNRVRVLEEGHLDLKESDKQMRMIIESFSEQIKAQAEKQSETNFKVDSVSQSVQILSGKVTEASTVQQLYLNEIKGHVNFMQDFMKGGSESASALRREQEVTKREREVTQRSWWTEFYKLAGVFVGGGAGVALIDFLIKQ